MELLEQALTPEEPPRGIPPEIWKQLDQPSGPEPSLYSLFEGMTALTQEVRLQGRAFKRLDDTLAPVGERLESQLEAHQEALEHSRQLAERALNLSAERVREARKEAEAPLLTTLLEVHERLQRGLEASLAAACPPVKGWRRWLSGPPAGRETLESLQQGYRLGLESLSEALQRCQVQALDCLGRPFDPKTMNAAAVETCPGVADGTVVEIIRPGYLWKGDLFRTAQVKVARADQSQGGMS